jgi:hypothetical protein
MFLSATSVDAKISLPITITPIIKIEYGVVKVYIDFTIEPYAEVNLKLYTSSGTCSSGQYRITADWGIDVTLNLDKLKINLWIWKKTWQIDEEVTFSPVSAQSISCSICNTCYSASGFKALYSSTSTSSSSSSKANGVHALGINTLSSTYTTEANCSDTVWLSASNSSLDYFGATVSANSSSVCQWVIDTGNDDEVVVFTIESCQLEYGYDFIFADGVNYPNTSSNVLEMISGNSFEVTGTDYCQGSTFTSTSRRMLVVLTSTYLNDTSFNASYKAFSKKTCQIYANSKLSSHTGYITDGTGVGDNRMANQSCSMVIEPSSVNLFNVYITYDLSQNGYDDSLSLTDCNGSSVYNFSGLGTSTINIPTSCLYVYYSASNLTDSSWGGGFGLQWNAQFESRPEILQGQNYSDDLFTSTSALGVGVGCNEYKYVASTSGYVVRLFANVTSGTVQFTLKKNSDSSLISQFNVSEGTNLLDIPPLSSPDSDFYLITVCPMDCPNDTSTSWNGVYLQKCSYSFNMHQRASISSSSEQNFRGSLVSGAQTYLDYDGFGMEAGIFLRGGVVCSNGVTDYSIYWSTAIDHSYTTSYPGAANFELVTNLAQRKSLYIGDYDGNFIGADFSWTSLSFMNIYLTLKPPSILRKK